MSKSIFITGTGTDVGKTYISALLVSKLRSAGINAGYYKAAVSGNQRLHGRLIPGDADYVRRIAGLAAAPKHLVSYTYEQAVSPHLACRLEGNPPELAVIKKDFQRLCGCYDFLTVEGSGGILCPLRVGEQELWLEDVIRELDLAVVIVAGSGLGTINSTVLTYEYLQQKQIAVKGIIFNNCRSDGSEAAGAKDTVKLNEANIIMERESIMEEDNIKLIQSRTGLPVLARVKRGAAELAVEAEVLAALYQ